MVSGEDLHSCKNHPLDFWGEFLHPKQRLHSEWENTGNRKKDRAVTLWFADVSNKSGGKCETVG